LLRKLVLHHSAAISDSNVRSFDRNERKSLLNAEREGEREREGAIEREEQMTMTFLYECRLLTTEGF